VPLGALKSGYWLFLLHKTNLQTLMTISAGIHTEGDEIELLVHSHDVFSSQVGFSYG